MHEFRVHTARARGIETAMMARQLLSPAERETLKRAGFKNDPLILHAVKIFNARIAAEESS